MHLAKQGRLYQEVVSFLRMNALGLQIPFIALRDQYIDTMVTASTAAENYPLLQREHFAELATLLMICEVLPPAHQALRKCGRGAGCSTVLRFVRAKYVMKRRENAV